MPGPLHVLHVIHRIGDGGADHVLTRLVNLTDADRVQHTVLTLGPGPGHEPLGDAVRLLQAPPGEATAAGALRALAEAGARPVDIVHGWVAHASIVGASVAAAMGVPLVLRQPTHMEQELRWCAAYAETYWRELRVAYRVAAAVVVPSPALVAVTRRACGVDAPVVIPNGIDVDAYVPWRARPRDGRPFTLGFVGRLYAQKDPLTLVESVAMLDRALDWRLRVYGEGDLRGPMIARLDVLGVRDRVTFAGFDRGWHDAAAGLDAFVLPTRYEGMSNAVLEAAAAGMPIITTDIAENRTVLEDGVDALLVPPEHPRALAAAIHRMADSPELAVTLGAGARRRARRFSLSAMVEAHLALYTRLARGAAAGHAA